MLDHLIGSSSANWRRVQAILILAVGYHLSKLSHRYNFTTPFVVKWNERLGKYSPLQVIIMTLMSVYAMKNTFLMMGLEGPDPLKNMYNRNYYRASWILTALDAGFWTAMPIKPKFVRDILSLVFSFFYLFFPREADNKVRNFRAMITVDAMRVSWQKQTNPYLYTLSSLLRPWFGIKKKLLIPRPRSHPHDDEPVTAYLYFTGTEKELAECESLIFNIPGGGFVTMPPVCHESYLSYWCKETKVPILSIDYKKAPEYPYPYAVEECFDAYRTVVETRGRILGIKGLKESAIATNGCKHHVELPIALVGDSAGGSISTAMMYKILEWSPAIPRPQGLVLIYPCLDFNISSWMDSEQINIYRSQSVKSMTSLWEAKNHYKHKSPLSTVADTESKWRNVHYPSIEEQIRRQSYGSKLNELPNARQATGPAKSKPKFDFKGDMISARSKNIQLTMTSRMTFFNDRILTPDLMRSMAILYIGPHNRPDFARDYYLSPIVGPEHLLAQFPKTYLICGEKDPMVDDTILFAGRIRQAKQRAERRQSKVNMSPNVNPTANPPKSTVPLLGIAPLSKMNGSHHHNPLKASSFVVGSGDDESSESQSSSENSDEDENDHNLTSVPTALHLPYTTNGASLPSVESYARLYPHTNSSHPVLTLNSNPSQSQPCGDRFTSIDPHFGVEVRLLEGMSHAFLSMIPFLPEAMGTTQYIASWLVDIFEANSENLEDKS